MSEPAPGATWTASLGRACAWVLVVLVPVQILSGFAFTDPAATTVIEARDRLAEPLWLVVDWLFVLAASGHAAIAVVGRATPRGARSTWRSAADLAAIAIAALAVALMTLTVLAV